MKGNPDELLHVFVNLITNGVQAIQVRGTLTPRNEGRPGRHGQRLRKRYGMWHSQESLFGKF